MRIPLRLKNSAVAALSRGVLIGIVLSVVFLAGYLFRDRLPPATASRLTPTTLTPVSEVGLYPLLTQAQDLLNNNYLRDQPPQRQLEYAAIRGVLSALDDKYTFLVDPPVAH